MVTVEVTALDTVPNRRAHMDVQTFSDAGWEALTAQDNWEKDTAPDGSCVLVYHVGSIALIFRQLTG